MKHLLTIALAIGLTLTLTSCFQVIKWVFGHHGDDNKPQKDTTTAIISGSMTATAGDSTATMRQPDFDDDEPSAKGMDDQNLDDVGQGLDEEQPGRGDGVMDEPDPYKRYAGTPHDVVDFRQQMAHAHGKRYHNERFGYSYSYPSCFRTVSRSQNGDGQVVQCEEVVLSMYASHNAMNWTTAEACRQQAFHPTYKVVKPNYYIASGTMQSGEIYYEKCVLRGDTFITIQIAYPKRYQNDVEGLIAEIAAYRP